MVVLEDLLYSDEHQWVFQENELGTLGLTDYFREKIGEVAFVDLPNIGDQLIKGEPLGTIGTVDTIREIPSPLSGEVVEVNGLLQKDPSQVIKDPYNGGWMVKIYLSNPEELNSLMVAEEYRNMVEE